MFWYLIRQIRIIVTVSSLKSEIASERFSGPNVEF